MSPKAGEQTAPDRKAPEKPGPWVNPMHSRVPHASRDPVVSGETARPLVLAGRVPAASQASSKWV
jgi:hypothetical protein